MATAIDSTLTGGKTQEIVSEASAAAAPSNDAATDLPPELTALLTKAIGQALADGGSSSPTCAAIPPLK
ncbi:hypothetical protein [Nonomuraea sp. NPDC049750]|uniref:hypothetical protein n=1 Tax=Nonomuraea sp. NPDC049750 TaxID=3154738 RepID=UPI0033CE9775